MNKRQRIAELSEYLAQDLEVLAAALRAGSSFAQAVQVAAHEGEGPLADEWRRLVNELQRGASVSQALTHFEERVPLPAVRSMVSVVTILQETGGNLAGILLTLAETLRQEMAFQDKVRAMTAQGKLSGYVVGAMPFVILAALGFVAPDLLRPLFGTVCGWMMLVMVIVMVAIGTVLIQKIVTIEV